RVSYERVLSGPGFFSIYKFLRDQGYYEEPDWLAAELASGDPNPVIARHGLAGDVPPRARAGAQFAGVYGAGAGSPAFGCVAVGGVFLAGGIAPKLLPALRSGAFLDAFTDKGRFAGFMKHVEVTVSLNPKAALLGAAHCAMRL